MSDLLKTLSAAALVAFSAPAWAQDDTAPADQSQQPAGEDPADGASGGDAASDQPGDDGESDRPDVIEPSGADNLNMGQDAGQPGGEPAEGPGSSYVEGEFEDWQQRCVRAEEGPDPCQLYQLLRDEEGNAVAEMSVFPLPPGREAAAGATVITPLETLLTRNIRLSVDGGQAKQYPFDFCAQQGCFARIGFTGSEIAQFRRGASAQLTIVPAAAPDQQIDLTVSLSGFTAGYDAVTEANAEE